MESNTPGPELSSIGTALGELSRRVTVIAEDLAGGADDNVASDLFQVERLLVEAIRRLDKVGRSLSGKG